MSPRVIFRVVRGGVQQAIGSIGEGHAVAAIVGRHAVVVARRCLRQQVIDHVGGMDVVRSSDRGHVVVIIVGRHGRLSFSFGSGRWGKRVVVIVGDVIIGSVRYRSVVGTGRGWDIMSIVRHRGGGSRRTGRGGHRRRRRCRRRCGCWCGNCRGRRCRLGRCRCGCFLADDFGDRDLRWRYDHGGPWWRHLLGRQGAADEVQLGHDIVNLDAVGVKHDAGQHSLKVYALVEGGAEGPLLGHQALQDALDQLRVKRLPDGTQIGQLAVADLQ